jgi:hypothetical protein
MSVLIIGGDRVGSIEEQLKEFGATKTTHWDSRRNSTSHKKIPEDTDCIVMLTSYLKHNTMRYFKKGAKKMGIPVVCSKHSVSAMAEQWSRAFA